MKIERKRIAELIPAPYNPRQDIQPGDAEYEKLKRSLEEFGYVEPVIVNETTGHVVGGHQRLKVLRELGETEIDCVIVELPEPREKVLNIALNKISNKWDMDKLNVLLEDLQGTDIDLTITGFDSAEIDNLLTVNIEDDDEDEYYGDEREKTYNAYHMHEYDNTRTAGFYQFPTLKACHYIPESLIGFDTRKMYSDPPEGMGVHFFVDDYKFEGMWSRMHENIESLKRFSCVVMPDFSTYWDMPMAMKIWNLYRMRLVSQVMQDEGIQVLPLVRGLGDSSLTWCFEGIEPGGVIVYSSIGLGKVNNTFKDICRRELSAAIEQLKPECVVLYGKDIGFDFNGVPVKKIDFQRWRV